MRNVLISALALIAGCDAITNENSLESQISRAEVVYICADGTRIGRDPLTRQLVYVQGGAFMQTRGRIPRGTSPMEFCR